MINFKGIVPAIVEKSKSLYSATKTFVVKNAPEVLIATGIAGFATTVGFSINGAINATIAMVNEKEGAFRDLNLKEKIRHVFKYYTPAIITGVGSTVCIIFSNRVSSKRNAAITSAYLISEKAANFYREEIAKLTSEENAKAIENSVHHQISDSFREEHDKPMQLAFADRHTKIKCKEMASKQTFYASYNQIEKIENDINFRLLDEGQLTLNEIYDMFDLEHIMDGDNYVWDLTFQGKFKVWLEPRLDTELGDVWLEVDFGELRLKY